MNSETKVCQNCKSQFTIEPEDFVFYKKIDVPPPTWCPQCRMARRMNWGSDSTTLYLRQCQAPGHSEKIFSLYPESTPSPVYDHLFWASDAWDPLSYGRPYDFGKSFFEQFKSLLDVMPIRNLELINVINCGYCIGATDSKNCYLGSGLFGCENCSYSHVSLLCKDSVDAVLSLFDQQVYRVFSVDKSFQTTNSAYSDELINCDFMYDCRSCSDCLGCVGLRSKQYCIFNIQYSKSEYKKERKKYDLGSYRVRQEVAKKHRELVLKRPRKYAVIRNAPGCTGDNIINAKNSKYVFQAIEDIENCKYSLVLGRGAKDSYDVGGGGLKSSLLYESSSCVSDERVYFSYRVRGSHDIYYSRECYDSEYLFGCIGLRSKKYCILNKQYTKEEYFNLLPKVVEHMKLVVYKSPTNRIYGFGEFFPAEHSPYPYNSSWAIEYFPITKELAIKRGLRWQDIARNSYPITMPIGKIPDHIEQVSDTITSEVIACSHGGACDHGCNGVFRIIASELEFYRKFSIALPRECPTCRFREAIQYLTPYHLWKRRCECRAGAQRTGYVNSGKHFHGNADCPNEFETAYAPERPELLYCEPCYNGEIL